MTRAVKEIRCRRYLYEVVWNPEEKKQAWKYRGKIGEDKGFKPNSDELREHIYHEIRREAGEQAHQEGPQKTQGSDKEISPKQHW